MNELGATLDHALVEELEHTVGTATLREHVQSGGESPQGCIPLSEVQTVFPDSKLVTGPDSTSHSLPEHTLARHTDFSPEILDQIFGLLSPDPLKLPPVLTDQAWVLGRVCSSWRRLSRTIPGLWTTHVVVDDTCGHHKTPLMQLRCAEDILPEVAFISLWVRDIVHLPMKALILHLPRINRLTWDFSHNRELQEAMETFQPGSLSRLEILKVTVAHTNPNINKKTAIEYKAAAEVLGIFGRSSRLRDLTLSCDNPTFLFSDIPWSQLHSFSLLPADHTGQSTAVTLSYWMELGRQNPFLHMSSLQSLTLNMKIDYFNLILSFDFPWHQILSFTVECPEYEFPILPKLMKVLQGCISLTNLKLRIHVSWGSEAIHHLGDNSILPSLNFLDVAGIPSSMIRYLSSLGNLHLLHVDRIELQEFYEIVKQCPSLTTFSGELYGQPTSMSTGNVFCPHLTTMTTSFINGRSFPTMLEAPLTSLTISANDEPNLQSIIDLIRNSGKHLQHFSLSSDEEMLHDPSRVQSFRELLSYLHPCVNLHIFGIFLPHDILEEIASGQLLPRLEILNVSVNPPVPFLEAIRRRLNREATSGWIRLRDIQGNLPYRSSEAKRKQMKLGLKELETEYGVKCTTMWGYY